MASITRTLGGNVEEIMGMLRMTTIENHHYHALLIKISTMCLLLYNNNKNKPLMIKTISESKMCLLLPCRVES